MILPWVGCISIGMILIERLWMQNSTQLPERLKKVKKDPSLAVDHSDYGEYKGRDLFEELHPEAAKKWDAQQNGQKEKQLKLGF